MRGRNCCEAVIHLFELQSLHDALDLVNHESWFSFCRLRDRRSSMEANIDGVGNVAVNVTGVALRIVVVIL